MSSASVAKTVAKKLKYYLDVQRREDGFDLSGPFHPREDPIPLRAGPTLNYDGIHDRSLKHYFHDNTIKRQLQNMHTAKDQGSREGSVRGFVDENMASVDYRLKPGPISPYALPQTVKPRPPAHRPKALLSVEEYMKTKRGAKRRKIPTNVVGKPRRMMRRSPPQHVSRDERERLVNMATKLIVATETVALPATKKQSKGFQASEQEIPRLQREKQRVATESLSSDSEASQRVSRRPAPPRAKPRSAPSRRPDSTFFKSSPPDRDGKKHTRSGVHVVLPGGSQSDDDERLKSLVGRMNLDRRGSSVMASHHRSKDSRPKSAGLPLKSQAVGPDEDSYDDEEFESVGSPRLSSTHATPRLSWMETEHDMIDMSTQTVVHSGTQTMKQDDEDGMQTERQIILPPRLLPIKRNSVDEVKEVGVSTVTATQGASTSDMPTSTPLSAETQTRNRDLEPKVLAYEVYVLTGDKLGAGTKAVVKLTLFGEYGNSGERQLLRSRTHRTKFQRAQVDIFVIDSVFLGKLSSIRIGHSETKLGYGWFLDKVFVKEGPEATRAFEFNCNRWLSSRDDDGQIIRDLPVSDVLPASHLIAVLPRIDKRQEDDFFGSASESDSFSSGEDDGVPAPDLREARKKPKNKTDSRRDKPPISSKRPAKLPEPVVEAETQEEHFVAVKAENLFDISEGEEEGQDGDNGRFFQPEENNDESEDEDAKKGFKRYAKKRRDNDENASESEEETDEKEKSKITKTKAVTTAVSTFLNHKEPGKESKEESSRQEAQPTLEEDQRIGTEETKEEEQDDDDDDESEEEEDGKKDKEEEEEEEEEPRVEFTGAAKPEHERERPVSAQSDDFVDGFRAGVRAKQEKERELHRESISESENILRRGSSIHEAAKNGDLERVKELIRVVPAMKNTTDERGMNPLHVAAANGRLDCVKWLAVSGVDLAEETPTGYTAMHLAAMNGHVNCMMILSAMGSALSGRTVDELTPLHLACMSGFTECVKWLIANRAKVDVLDNNGRTPLDIAEEYEHEDLVKLLKNFNNELTRQDSTLSQLMTSEHKRRKSVDSMGSDQDGVPSKVSDSGVGGLESGEDSWISDNEEDLVVEHMKDSRPDSASRQRPGSGTERPTSASRARTDSMTTIEDKKKNFEKQRSKMQKRNSSFLDSIRMEVENEEEF